MAPKTARKMPAKPAPEKLSEALQDLRPASEQAPASTEQPKAKAARKSRSDLYANYKPVDTDVITLVSGGKPKQKDSMAAAKFALYGEGNITVGEVFAKCRGDNAATFTNEDGKVQKLKPSIRWDWAHGLIQINGNAYVRS